MTKSSKTIFKKYSISEGLAKFPSAIAAEKRAEICKACGITRETLSRIENIKETDDREIPYGWAVHICRIVGIELKKFIHE